MESWNGRTVLKSKNLVLICGVLFFYGEFYEKVFQTIHGENGNCLAACLCSILGLDIKDVPNFCEKGNGWFKDCNDFLRKFNLGLLAMDYNVISRTQSDYDYHYIVQGKSPRGFYHAVVYHKGEMVHDPHSSGLGLINFADVIVFVRRGNVIK